VLAETPQMFLDHGIHLMMQKQNAQPLAHNPTFPI
jgi:hypothetical protein